MEAAGIVLHLFPEDIESTAEFYQHTLGFHLGVRFPESGPMKWCSLRLGHSEVMLAKMPDESNVQPQGMTAELVNEIRGRHGGKSSAVAYVRVDDVDHHYQHAKELGATIVDPLGDRYWGQREYTVADLEGNLLTFWKVITM